LTDGSLACGWWLLDGLCAVAGRWQINGCRGLRRLSGVRGGEWQAGGDVSWCLGGACSGCGVCLVPGQKPNS
jgi:hypothetical protein